MDQREWIIGSRASLLAVRQSEMVMEYLQKQHPVRLLTMQTKGDRILDRRLDQIGGKGLFVQELEAAMREGRTDFSVHSLKDMPMELPEDLPILAYSKREDARDVLVLPKGATELDKSKPIGTSSPRRILQLQRLYPDCTFASIRGNLQTRLAKLDNGEFSAIVLAAAGLKRLGLEERISRYFSVDEVIPAAGQAILAIQGKNHAEIFADYTDENAKTAAICERAFVRALQGGCSSPIAAHATVAHGQITLRGFYVPEGTQQIFEGRLCGTDAEALGTELAQRLLAEERSMV